MCGNYVIFIKINLKYSELSLSVRHKISSAKSTKVLCLSMHYGEFSQCAFMYTMVSLQKRVSMRFIYVQYMLLLLTLSVYFMPSICWHVMSCFNQ